LKIPEPDITTDRLQIRRLELTDTRAIYDIFSDKEVTRFWSSEVFTELEQAREFIRQTHEGFEDLRLLEWGIELKEGGKLIGTCAYSSWHRKHRRAEIGAAIHRDYWNKGIMTELMPPFLEYGFNNLNLHRIEADVDPENKPAIHLLEKFGFQREGRLRERFLFDGKYQDSVIYSLLEDEVKF